MRHIAIALLFAFLSASASSASFARTWTDLKGRQVEGDFVALKDGKVKIKRNSDGKEFDFPLDELSDADQDFVKFQAAVAKLKGLGAKVTLDKKTGEVVSVELASGDKPFADADLEHLAQLTNLESLILVDLKLSNGNLRHLQRLANLRILNLGSQQITDDGLVHLKGLPKLEELHLSWTKVTDAGLIHVKEIKTLKRLDFSYLLGHSRINDAGFRQLEKGDLVARVTAL